MSGVEYQQLEQTKFASGQFELLARGDDRLCGDINGYVAEFDLAGRNAAVTTYDRSHPCLQFAQVERLHEIVVGSDVENVDLVADVGSCGDDEDGGVNARTAQLLQHVRTAHAGQHEVEDDQVEGIFLDPLRGAVAIRQPFDGMSTAAQARCNRSAEIDGVLDQKRTHDMQCLLDRCTQVPVRSDGFLLLVRASPASAAKVRALLEPLIGAVFEVLAD